ncbi:MAG: CAP domain-containing protein, partial [Anaerolineae bacterium]|nr:CAP domain-containing protein [Anaerolineae bacterium]
MVLVTTGQESRSLPRDLDKELEVITMLNRYRIRDGRGPLLRNPDLDYLAQIQAEYMQQWLPLTGQELDYHVDRFGDGITRRAELIDWPTYGFVDAPFVGEIAAYFPSVQGMMDFWNNSQDHRNDIYSYGYREVGVTVLRNGNWFLAYVVFGARPDVLPVFYDAQLGKLVLTTDQSPFIFNRFVPTLVQIEDEAGQRLHVDEWLPWRSRIPLPEGAGQFITVIYSDGVREVRTTVDLYQALLYPSEGRGSRALSSLTVVTGTPRATVTPMPPTPTWTPSPMPQGDQYDIVLHYDANSLNFINQSGEELNLQPLSIVVPGMGAISADWMGTYSE